MSDSMATQFWMILITALFFSSLTAYFAGKRGRSPIIWWLIGFSFGLLGLVALFILPNAQEEEDAVTYSENLNQDTLLSPLPVTEIAEPEVEKLWYYLDDDHHQFGPVSVVALREQWNTGMLKLDSFVWTKEMSDWQKVESLPDLLHVLSNPSID